MPLTFRLGVAVLACALASACDNASESKQTQGAPATAGKPKVATAAIPPHMVAAVAAGKSATAITVHFMLETSPAVGAMLPVQIALIPMRSFDSVRVHFEAQDGLSLYTGQELEAQLKVEPQSVIKHQLTLQPTREGVFMVTAVVETEGDEGMVSRVFMIPVMVHAATAPAAPAPTPAKPPADSPAG